MICPATYIHLRFLWSLESILTSERPPVMIHRHSYNQRQSHKVDDDKWLCLTLLFLLMSIYRTK